MSTMPQTAPAARPTARPATGTAPKGSFLTRKTAGLPVWAWGVIVVGGVVAYVVWARMQSSSAATTAATTAPATTGSSGPGGFGYSGNGIGSSPAASSTPASPGNPALPFQVQSGSGWGVPSNPAATPITDAAGNVYEWLDGPESQSATNSGVQQYSEILPGVFVPANANTPQAPGTPLYMMVPPGTGTNPAAPTAAAVA